MTPLATDLRRAFERTIITARDAAEKGAENALRVLAVDQPTPFATLAPDQRKLREALRARAQTLSRGAGDDGFRELVAEVAYEQWHRMLFARFLAENDLLIHPQHRVPVTLQECGELAAEEGEPDRWMVAAKYASYMLPGIFKRNDPAVQVPLAANDRQTLEALLQGIPVEVFHADDGLGWVYQFWQTKAKQEVNKSERKIGGRDLPAVTQLFTEHYMVRFLLENTLGAWWVSRHPESPLRAAWEYLRFRDDGTPAAGTFSGWPEHARGVTVMDPCMGSGHFLVAAGEMLRKMRMEEEGLEERVAAEAVIRDNLYGLELDARCTQIAAFALAFDAWKNAGGYRPLPLPNLGCSGIAVGQRVEEWRKLAGSDDKLRYALQRLHALFLLAPELGSFIDPADLPPNERMFAADYDQVAPLLDQALARAGADEVAAVFGEAAAGAARAGRILAGTYTLVVTNPPYLARGRQANQLKDYIERKHNAAKADTATAFIERCRAFTRPSGGYAMVTPQNWLFLTGYRKLREQLLKEQSWQMVFRLGEHGFDSQQAAGAFTALICLCNCPAPAAHTFTGLDASEPNTPNEKAKLLRVASLSEAEQAAQLGHPDSRVRLEPRANMSPPLSEFASFHNGIQAGDFERFRRRFWEQPISDEWEFEQASVDETREYSGMSGTFFWQSGSGAYRSFVGERLGESGVAAWIRGRDAWGKSGVLVSAMRDLKVSLYSGRLFDDNTVAVIPRDASHIVPIWTFLSSEEYSREIRKIDQALKVRGALVQVPFDLEHWQQVAAERYPDGLPEPNSDDPTQWLFRGHVVGSTAPLQVAVARLLGSHWPEQAPVGDTVIEPLESFEAGDGIVCLPAVQGERPAAERLRALLAAAHATPPSGPRPKGALPWPGLPEDANAWIIHMLVQAGSPGKTLEQWLRDDFFDQHCTLFHQRPLIWHIWDGERDGFAALVNYHKLDRKNLERLVYHYLNAWTDMQQKLSDAGEAGAERKLFAAQELKRRLELILAGEPPYDIYVRWKSEAQQPMGWDPDLDDGVRLNIRPFMTADVLRRRPNIKWGVDRGKNPDGSVRDNDKHLTLAEKRAARAKAGL